MEIIARPLFLVLLMTIAFFAARAVMRLIPEGKFKQLMRKEIHIIPPDPQERR